jgi:4-amino-4-deoxy-L-arabinose transferase-like glycosyltransferase
LNNTARADRDLRIAFLIVTVAALVRLAMAAVVPVVPDEAYYWEWSRHLAAGYFDHPPAIALLIRAGTALAGDTPFGLRLVVNIAGYVATIAAILLAYRLGQGTAARRTAWVVAAMPLAGAGLVLATPDVPLLAAVAVALLALDLALAAPAPPASLAWWGVAGAAMGLALDAKYTAALIGAGVVIALIGHPGLRAEWRRPGVYVACAIAALLFLPVVRWNAAHDWVSFRFQLQHGLVPKGRSGPLARELSLLGGQILLVSPLLFVGLVLAVAGAFRREAPRRALLATVATFVAGFFLWSALRRSVEPNWLAPAVLTAAVVYATGARPRWERAAIGLGVVMVIAIYVQVLAPFLPFPAGRDPSAQGAGWRQAALQLDAVRQAQTTQHVWLAANRYQDAAELAFHLPRHPTVYSLNIDGRPNQYDLWPRFPQAARTGDVLILVLPDEPRTPEAIFTLLPHCTSMARDETIELRRGGELIGIRRIWTCTGWRGTWPSVPPVSRPAPPSPPTHTTLHIWHRSSPVTWTRSSPPTASASNASCSIFSASRASARSRSTTPTRCARPNGCRPRCGRPASRRRF